MFLAFQYPQEIAGVSVIQFLRQALSARKGIDLSVLELRLAIMDWMKRLGMDASFADRYLNEGFSGGEKKRNEILQMAILEPELAVLDETDSGLDIDALRTVARGIEEVRKDRPSLGIVLITHYQRLLSELTPDKVHILIDGRIVDSGGPELAEKLEGRATRRGRWPDGRDQDRARRRPDPQGLPGLRPGDQRPAHRVPRLGRRRARSPARCSRPWSGSTRRRTPPPTAARTSWPPTPPRPSSRPG